MKKEVLLIGLVNLNRDGGDVNHFKLLVKYLGDVFKVTVCAIGDNRAVHLSFKFPNYRLYRVAYWNWIILYKCLRHCLNHRVSAIYFRESGLIISPYILSLILRKPLFVEVNGVLLDDTPIPKLLTKTLFRLLYLVPKRIFASCGYRQLISRDFKANINKLVTVHLGYHFDSEREYMDRICDVHEGMTIAFIGNLHPYQGLFGFILGFNRFLINSGREDIVLKIFGDGVDKPRLISLVNELNINKHVQFVGFIDQVKLNAILKSVQLCISPFAFDRGDEFTISALKTYDYFNAQCAILTSKMDENAPFIKEHGLGDYFEMGTEEEIESKLYWLLSADGQNMIRECYSKKYGWLADRLSWKNRFDIITGELLKEI